MLTSYAQAQANHGLAKKHQHQRLAVKAPAKMKLYQFLTHNPWQTCVIALSSLRHMHLDIKTSPLPNHFSSGSTVGKNLKQPYLVVLKSHYK